MRHILCWVTLFAIVLMPIYSFPEELAPVSVPAAISVVQSIVSIGASVNSLINGNKDKAAEEQFRREVISRLNKIDQQLTTIQNKLDAINARFDELKVHIDKQLEHQRVVDLLAVIRAIDQHYPTWSEPGYTPDPSGTVPPPSAILGELRLKVAAVREYPSYANFSTVALGMAYEHLLLVNVFHQPDDNEDAQRGFAQYAAFFKEAASVAPDKPGTVGQGWITADAALKELDARYVALPKPLYCAQGGHLCVPSNPNDWNWYFNVVRVVPYEGTPVSGFHATHVSSVPERDCAGIFIDGPGGNPEGVCKSNPPIFPRQRYCTQLFAAQLSNLIDQPCPLEALHQTAVDRKTAVDELQAALQGLRAYYFQAARWAGTPPTKIVFLSPDRPRPVSVAAKGKAASSSHAAQ